MCRSPKVPLAGKGLKVESSDHFLSRILGRSLERTRVALQEVAAADKGFSGLLADEGRKTEGRTDVM